MQTSRGNTSSPRTYYATDNDIISGLVFYRIRQVDLDGRSKLSITRTTRRVVTEKIDWVVYPNPTKEWLQIDYLYAGNKPAAKLMLYTSEGRLVKQTDMHQLSATISVAEFPAGMYFLKLIDNNGMVTTRKVIVSR